MFEKLGSKDNSGIFVSTIGLICSIILAGILVWQIGGNPAIVGILASLSVFFQLIGLVAAKRRFSGLNDQLNANTVGLDQLKSVVGHHRSKFDLLANEKKRLINKVDALLESFPGIVIIGSLQGKYLQVNSTYANLLSIDQSKFTDRKIGEVGEPVAIIESIKELMENNETNKYMTTGDEANTHHFSLNFRSDDSGFIIILGVDITKRINFQNELELINRELDKRIPFLLLVLRQP